MDIGVRELRDRLSRHLARVRDGATLTVTEHGRPIAQIVPIQRHSALDQLIAEGLVQPPAAIRRPAPRPVTASGPVSDLVTDQRR